MLWIPSGPEVLFKPHPKAGYMDALFFLSNNEFFSCNTGWTIYGEIIDVLFFYLEGIMDKVTVTDKQLSFSQAEYKFKRRSLRVVIYFWPR